ncbi:hypothetical protein DFA_11010 [Cavenderia fasciculata]|uniref:Uncharacterized protein n=1 Tax=Cavenderia fasciculata TaxID=261658 RepID=F4QC12_CACFS|nr:uncharacterized protein DFA_11010 [Cavenderia fasciculata]EGG14750.1 hypothetical protein DFA_11010 [Cavenderia fasciculata]|eukprot:XP_004351258.1 hypothetical protein DFA_11010 [Cavenderia fasciculata]
MSLIIQHGAPFIEKFLEIFEPHSAEAVPVQDEYYLVLFKTVDYIHFTVLHNGKYYHSYPESNVEIIANTSYELAFVKNPTMDHKMWLKFRFLHKPKPEEFNRRLIELMDKVWTDEYNCLCYALDLMGIEFPQQYLSLKIWEDYDFLKKVGAGIVILEAINLAALALGGIIGHKNLGGNAAAPASPTLGGATAGTGSGESTSAPVVAND